ncbi:MAG: hypothetical protein HY304_09610 [candidate division Zixibacteria bacterium]|nr:hypothetical protein [candidate division Zixibacteria bacterium]
MANYLRPIEDQFALSRHNLSDTYVRRGTDASPACSRCHTTEGYQVYLATGQEAPLEASSHISCFACHAPHTNRDFSRRNEDSTTHLAVGGTYDKGPSNTCAVCHQVREPNPPIESSEPITSSRWGPHHGPQSNILSGKGAYVLPGATYDAAAAHNIGITEGCVNCHMAALPDNVVAGGHSFAITYEATSGSSTVDRVNSKGCACHGWTSDVVATTAVEAHQATFEHDLGELGDMLVARGWLNGAKNAVTTGAAAPTTKEARGIVFNYLMLLEDKSGGVHNPKYTASIIAAAKAYLESLGPQ